MFTDHLGSITTLVRNSDGYKVEMSYDAWGNRRDPATWENYNGTLISIITDRGYTGHEHLHEFTLINMNGRMYDPQTARFLSPDVVVSDPANPASYNPYAYVLNNPLRYTDPSGYEPFTIAAGVIAAFILYGSHAKQNANPVTGKWDWNITNWFGKDKPGLMLGITNTSFKHFFSNTTFFVSMDNTNGAGITLGYHTRYHFGGGSSPQNLYFPNDNIATAEAAAVNSIARGTNSYSKITAAIDNYMDILAANVMRAYGGNWLPGIEVVWNGKYGSGSIVGGVPEWWSGGTAANSGGNSWYSPYNLPGWARLGMASSLPAFGPAGAFMHYPDAISVSGGVKIITGVGGSDVEGGYIWLLNGPNKGAGAPMADLGMFAGGVPSASLGATVTEYYYLSGDYSNFGFDNIRDGRFAVYSSVGEVLNVGGGASIMGNRGSGYVVGISYTISVGVSALPISIDGNWGQTKIY